MNRNLLILIFIILGSCAIDITQEVQNVEEAEFDEPSFKEWLAEHNLTEEQFTDTTGRKVFELWAYGDPIEKADSLMYWYPSTDSSYYLISNFNCDDCSRLEEDWKDIRLRFHESGTEDVRIGIMLLDSTSQRKVDIH